MSGDNIIVKLNQNNFVYDLIAKDPDCFILLTNIALRARRIPDVFYNLKIGEAFLGDYKKMGLKTEQRYRTAKNNAQKYGLATFKATNKGTIGRLTDSSVYDIKIYNKNKA